MTKQVIDLSGPQGNAFALMALAKKSLKELGHTDEEIKEILDEMKSSDYDHLLDVFEKHLGDFFILRR